MVNYNKITYTPPIDITVCAKQYASPHPSGRGFGDIAHGVRIIELIKNKLPSSNLNFIVEYSGDAKEYKVINRIVTGSKVNHVIFSRKLSEQQQIKSLAIAQKWIDSAVAIIHGPADIIEHIQWSKSAKAKMLSFAEYENNHGYYEFANYPIERIGISRNLLHISNYQGITADYKFKASILNQLFTNIRVNNSTIFLCYTGAGTEDFFIPLLAIILQLDKTNSRDICVITPTAFDENNTEIIQKIINILGYHSRINIRCITANEQKTYSYVNKGMVESEQAKTIYYAVPFPLDECDIKKMNLTASYILSTGDISFSDAISANKIPLMHKRKQEKPTIFTEVAIYNFYNEKEDVKPYINLWKNITEIFATANFKNSACIKKMLLILLNNNISLLNTAKWHEIETEFTNAIIANNKLEQTIVDYINSKISSSKVSIN